MTEQPQTVTAPVRARRIGRGVAAAVFASGLITGIALAGLRIAQADSRPAYAAARATAPSRGEGFVGPAGRGGLGRNVLHGEFTTPAPGGGYQTLAIQRGKVTSVDASSITLTSEDGFSRSYAVDDNTLVNAGNDGIADVKKGDTVHITAVVSGSTARAVQIVDRTNVARLRGRWMRPRPTTSPAGTPSGV